MWASLLTSNSTTWGFPATVMTREKGKPKQCCSSYCVHHISSLTDCNISPALCGEIVFFFLLEFLVHFIYSFSSVASCFTWSNQSLTISSSLLKYSFHNQAATKQNQDSLLFHLLKNVSTTSLSQQHNYSSYFSSTQFILFKCAVSPTLFNWCLWFRLRFGWNGAPHLTADSTSLKSRMWVWVAFNRRPERSANKDIMRWRLTSVLCFSEDTAKARCYYCACNLGCLN